LRTVKVAQKEGHWLEVGICKETWISKW